MSADPPAEPDADLAEAALHEPSRSFARKNSAARSRWMRWAVFVLIALLGLVLRLPQLGVRPMHTDEAVNAYIVGQLLAGETFAYDSRDRHGPGLVALALPLARIQGAKTFSDLTETELRLTTVLAGTLTILLFGVAVDMFGFMPCVIAALLFACASLPVYYDRYFIHESLFSAATFGLILAGWPACKKPTALRAALAGACAALMLACKETAVLNILALAAAAFGFWLWNLHGKRLALWRPQAMMAAAVVFLLVTLMLFTWFGSNWKALGALLEAAPNFLARAQDAGHQEPISYYFRLITAAGPAD